MIWFCNKIPVINPPADTEIFLIGEFNQERQPPLEIYLQIGFDEEDVRFKDSDKHRLYHHAPSGRIPTDLDPDDILAKYNHKISKFKEKFSGMEYSEIINLFQTGQ